MKHLTAAELEAGLAHVQASPEDGGALEMIVRRPQTNAREALDEGMLDLAEGLVGDNWRTKGSQRRRMVPLTRNAAQHHER